MEISLLARLPSSLVPSAASVVKRVREREPPDPASKTNSPRQGRWNLNAHRLPAPRRGASVRFSNPVAGATG